MTRSVLTPRKRFCTIGLKYGFDRSNPDGGISLHAHSASFIHPVSKEAIEIIAPVPSDNLWKVITEGV